MGRKRSAEVTEKRKPVNVRPIERKHAGKVVEPYKIMETLVEANHPELKDATILLCYRKGWKPDVDKVLTGARIKKASDLDRAIGSRFGDSYDFVMQLNEEVWPVFSELDKTILIDHELTHAKPDLDRDGVQRKDEKNRLCWRVRKHPIQEFPEIIERYGAAVVLKMNDTLLDAKESAGMPLFNQPAQGDDGEAAKPDTNPDGWKRLPVSALDIPASYVTAMAEHGKPIKTLGRLSKHMNEQSKWWAREINGIGDVAKEKIEVAWGTFWAEHPEYAEPRPVDEAEAAEAVEGK